MEKVKERKEKKGADGEKMWQRGVIAERIERVQLHLMVGEV